MDEEEEDDEENDDDDEDDDVDDAEDVDAGDADAADNDTVDDVADTGDTKGTVDDMPADADDAADADDVDDAENQVIAHGDDTDDTDDENDLRMEKNILDPNIYVDTKDRCSTSILTDYERVRILGERTAQLSQGAKPMLMGATAMNPRIVAQLELESGMIPFKIVRTMPNGKRELWYLKELRLKESYIKYGFTGGSINQENIRAINRAYKKGDNIDGYFNHHKKSS